MPKIILTCAPESKKGAVSEIKKTDPSARVTSWLAEGIALVQLDRGWDEIVQAFHSRPPIWIRHLCLAEVSVPIRNDALDLITLENMLEVVLLNLDMEQSFSVQTRIVGEAHRWQYARFDVNERLAALVTSWGVSLDVRQPDQVLSVVLTADTGYMGLSRARENLSSWAGGERRYRRDPEQISRASFKLLEALEVFQIEMPAQGRALDMGAAPGGWSRVLANKGLEVLAVDPAKLDPRVLVHPNVTHIRKTVQTTRFKGDFDLIVNDMRMDAVESARMMVEYAYLLKAGAVAIATLKLPEKRIGEKTTAALRLLRQQYDIIGARQLFHNRSEITVAFRPSRIEKTN